VTLLQRSQKPQRTKIPTSGSARGGEAGCITPCEGLRLHPDHYTRIDVYREQLLDLARRLEEADIGLSCWVGDGYYAKKKMFAAVDRIGSHLITRLRSDANLRYLYTGPPTGTQGPEKQYDGKIRWDDREQLAERFEEVGRLPGRSEIRILTTVANSPHFGRDFRVVLLLGPDDHVVLCSTDTTRPAEQIAAYYRLRTTDFVLPTSYYRLRYQIEFVIRDAKGSSPARSCLLVQHAGLIRGIPRHCQARSQEKIDFHLNASLSSTVGLLRLLTRRTGQSLHTCRREACNRMRIDRLLSKLGLCAGFDRSDPRLQDVVRTGRMAVCGVISPYLTCTNHCSHYLPRITTYRASALRY